MTYGDHWPQQASSPARAPVHREKLVLDREDGYAQSTKSAHTLVVGTTELYKNGRIRLIPVCEHRGLALQVPS